MASNDLSRILDEWPYEPGQINVRVIEGDDGRPKIQIRLQLGILQLEMTGRPDGAAPGGHESLLEFQLERRERYAAESGGPEGFVLSPDECKALREEAVLYYHRYVGLFALEDWAGVIRDTTRNLRVLDLLRDHAADEHDQIALEQFRPYILMMRTRARAAAAISDSKPKIALAIIDEGITEVEQALAEIGMGDRIEESSELQLLRAMREALVPKLPVSQRVELEERLRAALDAENYELAAILRDELRMMKE